MSTLRHFAEFGEQHFLTLSDSVTVSESISNEPQPNPTDSVTASETRVSEVSVVQSDTATTSDAGAKDVNHVQSLSVADDFNRADEPLTDSANWLPWPSLEAADLEVVSSRAKAVAPGVLSGNQWADTFADCEVSATLVAVDTGPFASLSARIGADDRFYSFYIEAGNVWLYYYDGTYNELDTAVHSFTPGDRFRLRAVGDQITGWVNGAQVLSATDSNLTFGRVALDGFEGDEWDDFAASELPADSVTVTDDLTTDTGGGLALTADPTDEVTVTDEVSAILMPTTDQPFPGGGRRRLYPPKDWEKALHDSVEVSDDHELEYIEGIPTRQQKRELALLLEA